MDSEDEDRERETTADLEAALERNPADQETRLELVIRYREEGLYEEALKTLESGLSFPGDRRPIYRWLADIRRRLHDLPGSKEALDRCLELGSDDPWDYEQLITICARLGKLREAEEAVKTWARRQPGRPAVARCERAVRRFRHFSRARPKTGFSHKEIAYGLYGTALLGTPHDDGIEIWRYYYNCFDEYDCGLVLWRFLELARALELRMGSVVAVQDGFSLPLALATSEIAGLPLKSLDSEFEGEAPLLVAATVDDPAVLAEDRAALEARAPARIYCLVLSGPFVFFRQEIPPDFACMETYAAVSWQSEVAADEDQMRGTISRRAAQNVARKIAAAYGKCEQSPEPNIRQQVEWYTVKHRELSCLQEPIWLTR